MASVNTCLCFVIIVWAARGCRNALHESLFRRNLSAAGGFQRGCGCDNDNGKGGHISAENLSVWREGPIPTRSDDRGYNGASSAGIVSITTSCPRTRLRCRRI